MQDKRRRGRGSGRKFGGGAGGDAFLRGEAGVADLAFAAAGDHAPGGVLAFAQHTGSARTPWLLTSHLFIELSHRMTLAGREKSRIRRVGQQEAASLGEPERNS